MREEKAMKCPKCRYVSHDYLDACRKCHTDLVEFKRKFNLRVLKPGELDLGELVSDTPPSEFRMTNDLARKVSMAKSQRVKAGLDEMAPEIEVDIQFDTDNPPTSTEPGELTKTFYVPEVLAKQMSEVNLPDREAGLDEMTAAPEADMPFDTDNPPTSTEPGGLTKMFYVGLDEIAAAPEADMPFDTDNPEPLAENTTDPSAAKLDRTVPLANPESSAQDTQHPPVNTLDMSVGNLDDCFDEFEDIQLDTSEIDHDIDLALDLPSSTEIELTCDYDAAEKEIEELTSDISSTSVSSETLEPGLSEAQEEAFESEALIDNLADNELVYEPEGTDNVPSPTEEHNAGTETGTMSDPDERENREHI
jgi:hypothetical protein